MQSLRDQMAELLCPVCLDPYDNPVTIPTCNHHVCRKHILPLARYYKEDTTTCEFPCPKCRTLAMFVENPMSEEEIRVNNDMKAAVEFAVKILYMRQQNSAPPEPSLNVMAPKAPSVVTPVVAPQPSAPSVIDKKEIDKKEMERAVARRKLDIELQHEEEAKAQWKAMVAMNRQTQQLHLDSVVNEKVAGVGNVDLVTDEEWYEKEREFERLKRQRELEKERNRLEKEHEIENKILAFVKASEARTNAMAADRARREKEIDFHLNKLERLSDIGFQLTRQQVPKMGTPPRPPSAPPLPRGEYDIDIANDKELRLAELRAEDAFAAKARERATAQLKAQIAEERAMKLIAEINGKKQRGNSVPKKAIPKPSYVPKVNKRQVI